MGLHAQGYEGGGGLVWDEARCNRAHESRLSVVHRQTVVRYGRVLGTMRELGELEGGPEAVADLRDVYVPFGAARVSWQAYCCFSHEGRQLLALVLRAPELTVAFARKAAAKGAGAVGERTGNGSDANEASYSELLRFIADEVSGLDQKTIRPGHALPLGHPLEPALRAATRREEVAVAAYDVLRRARVDGENVVREQYYEQLRQRISR
jgi:hypothetical protein